MFRSACIQRSTCVSTICFAGLLTLYAAWASAAQYYVNDGFTNGDVYCSAIGSDATGDGTAGAPYATLTNLLVQQDLEPGDTAYVDTGLYTNTSVNVTTNDQGSVAAWMTIQGSTNEPAGGTRLTHEASPVQSIIYLNGPYIRMRHLTFVNAAAANVIYDNIGRCRGEFLTVSNSTSALLCYSGGSGQTVYENCLFANNDRAAYAAWVPWIGFLNCTFYSNKFVGRGARLWFTNCVMHVSDSAGRVYENFLEGGATGPRADYNTIFITNGAKITDSHSTLSAWQASSYGQDAHSLGSDPLLADPDAGDFHVKSQTGRYSNGVWVADAQQSLAIDAGATSFPYASEPDPNGARINIGRYGNTDQASKSLTNPVIHALTFNTHGRAAATQPLNWNPAGIWGEGATVYIDVSPDNGVSWSSVTTGVSVSAGTVSWDTTGWTSSIIARWRVCGTLSEAADTNDSVFTIGIGNYYINDDSTNGDIYTSAVGNDATGDGRTNSPFRTLAAVLAARDLEPGDTVYLDTGIYTNTTATVILDDQGSSSDWVTLQGSTNEAEGGTRLTHEASPVQSIIYLNGPYVRLRHLTMVNAAATYVIYDNIGRCRGEFLVLTNSQYGVIAYSGGSGQTVYENCLFANASGSIAYAAWAPTIGFLNCTFYGNKYSIYAAKFWVTNCVICVDGSGNYAYYNTGTGLKADYNTIFVTNGAKVARVGSTDYASLSAWQGYNAQDLHSLASDPLLADPDAGDFHVKSYEGRYSNGTWVRDDVMSPSIDAGATNTAWSLEPRPNGYRVNCGWYGNTPEASQSRFRGTFFFIP